MRYLKKALGFMLTIMICMNMCSFTLAEDAQEEDVLAEQAEELVTEQIEEVQEEQKQVKEEVEEEAPAAENKESGKGGEVSASENESVKTTDDQEPASEAKTEDKGAEASVDENAGEEKNNSEEDENKTVVTEDDGTGEESEDKSDEKSEDKTEETGEDDAGVKDEEPVPSDSEKTSEVSVEVEEMEATDAEEEDLEEDIEIDIANVELDIEDVDEELLLSAKAPDDVTISLNELKNFYLEGEYTQKIYINLTSAGYLNLFIRWIDSTQTFTRATVRFMNAGLTSTYLSEVISSTNKLAEVSDWFDAGSYIILINIIADNGDNYWPLSYSVESRFEATSAVANNGTMSAYTTLPADGTYHNGLLSRTSNSRWWKVTLSEAGYLEVDVRSFVTGAVESDVFLLRDGQVNRRLIRPLSVTLPAASPTNPEFKYASTWLEAGEYYVNVFAKDQQTGEYGLMVTFKAANNTESSNDGTYLNANKLTLDGPTIRGLLSYTDEVDMYTFNVPDTINVNVTAAAFMNSMNVKLYNSNMRTQIADLSDSGTDGNMNKAHNHEDRIRLSAGDYILVISRDPDKDLTGIYEVRVRTTMTIKKVNLTNGLIYSLGEKATGNISYISGTPLEYYFHLQMLDPATGSYVNVDHITTNKNSFSFTPANPGVYRVLAQVTDGTYNDEQASDPFTVKQNSILNINTIDYNPSAPIAGTSMTITPGIGGGRSVVQVIYEIYTSGGTLVDRVVTSGAAAKWTPKNAGTYKVMVVATDGLSWASKWGAPFTVSAAPAMTISDIKLSTTNAVKKNSPITLEVIASDGTPIQYIYETYYFGNFFTRTTSASNKFTFRPNASGTWKIMVVATDGKQWTSKWSDEFYVYDAPAYTVTVDADNTSVALNGTVNFELKYSGSPKITFRKYELWLSSPSVKVDEWTGNSDKHAFSFATAGSYRVMGVVCDSNGVYKSAWSPTITVAAPPAITLTAVTPNTTSSFVNDVVTFTVSNSTGTPTQYIYEVYNSSNTKIYSKTSADNTFKYQFKAAGTYRVMAVVTDGYNWTSMWSPSVTVTSYGSLQILRIDVEGGTSKTFFEPFTVAPVFNSGSKVQKIFFEVYDDTTGDLLGSANGKNASFTYKPQVGAAAAAPFTYKVMVVAYDSEGNWVSKWSDPIVYNLPTTLSIDNVTDNTVDMDDTGTYGAIELGDSVEFTGTIKAGTGAEVFESEFQVYYNPNSASAAGEMLVETVNTRNSDSLLTIPANRGYYRVMYVAFDGITWASMYSDWIYVRSDAY